MKKGFFSRLSRTIHLLFGSHGWSIIGSSLVIGFLYVWIMSGILLLGGLFFPIEIGLHDGESKNLGFSTILLFIIGVLVIFGWILVRGWYAIVIPIRSLEKKKSIHLGQDLELFFAHISQYFRFVFFYSLIFGFLVFISYWMVVVLTAFSPTLFPVGLIVIGILLSFFLFKVYFFWYHGFSESAISSKGLLEAAKMTRRKISKLAKDIILIQLISIVGSIVIVTIIALILSGLGLLQGLVDVIVLLSRDPGSYRDILLTFRQYFSENPLMIFISQVAISIIGSVWGVSRKALLHVYGVELYLDTRDEHHRENSFILPILNQDKYKSE